ncbi:MAG: hypothetical protein ABEH90_09660 [Halolamina sp.]
MAETSRSEATGPADPEGLDPADLDLHRQAPLRLSAGWVGFDDAALYLEEDGRRTRVAFENVTEVAYRDTDYFIAVLSLVLVGFGLWFVPRTPAALLFSLIGVASLYRLYRHRGEVVVRASGRAKPLTFHPEDGGEFYDALCEGMGGEVVSDRKALFGA